MIMAPDADVLWRPVPLLSSPFRKHWEIRVLLFAAPRVGARTAFGALQCLIYGWPDVFDPWSQSCRLNQQPEPVRHIPQMHNATLCLRQRHRRVVSNGCFLHVTALSLSSRYQRDILRKHLPSPRSVVQFLSCNWLLRIQSYRCTLSPSSFLQVIQW